MGTVATDPSDSATLCMVASKNPICSICIDIKEVDLVNLRSIKMAMVR
jgi:hypothetical protein